MLNKIQTKKNLLGMFLVVLALTGQKSLLATDTPMHYLTTDAGSRGAALMAFNVNGLEARLREELRIPATHRIQLCVGGEYIDAASFNQTHLDTLNRLNSARVEVRTILQAPEQTSFLSRCCACMTRCVR